MKIYKSEDSKTIYEYLDKLESNAEETLKFVSALKRELVKGYNAQKKIKKIEKRQLEESWDSIEK